MAMNPLIVFIFTFLQWVRLWSLAYLFVSATMQCHIQHLFIYLFIFLGGGAAGLPVFWQVKRKTVAQLGSLGLGTLQSCPKEFQGQNPGTFWLICFLNSSKHRSGSSASMNGEENLHQKSKLLRVWQSEFVISNWYNRFKITLDMALLWGSISVVSTKDNKIIGSLQPFIWLVPHVVALKLTSKWPFSSSITSDQGIPKTDRSGAWSTSWTETCH